MFENKLVCFDCAVASPVFCYLKPKEIARIEKNRIEVFFNSGETIMKSGTPNTHVISFFKGLAKISLDAKGGETFIVDFLRPQSFFSEPGLFIDKKHHFTISAIEPCELCLIKIDAFLDIMKENASMAFAFMKISNNFILNLVSKMESILVKHQHGRVAEALLYLSHSIYQNNPFELTISKKDLSEMTGLSKESVSRILHEFTMEGLIQITGKMIHLIKEDLLEQINRNG